MTELENVPSRRGRGVAEEYEVVDADLTTAEDEVIRIWGNSIGWPGRQEEGYRSYYLDPSVPRPFLKLLRHIPTRRIVGTLGVSPRRVMWHGREIRAAAFSQLCVEKPHRKVRPAKLLMGAAVEACRGSFDVAYGMPRTPDSNAFMQLLWAMGWRRACTGSRRVRVLRYAKYAGRLLPRPLAGYVGAVLDAGAWLRDSVRGGNGGLTVRWTERVEPSMAALWRSSPVADGWAAVRDETTLRWRFDGLVSFARRYLLLNDSSNDSLVAWFACDANAFDPDIFVVEDFWHARGADPVEPRVIRALCRATRVLGYSAVEMRLTAPEACFGPWKAQGFVTRNTGDTYVCWLNREVQGNGNGPYYITELDNDG